MILKLQNGNTVQNTDDVLIEGGNPLQGQPKEILVHPDPLEKKIQKLDNNPRRIFCNIEGQKQTF